MLEKALQDSEMYLGNMKHGSRLLASLEVFRTFLTAIFEQFPVKDQERDRICTTLEKTLTPVSRFGLTVRR